uniref:Uncharacterized protein n=1 Tax=Nymphaea colorata TaxID=210225 RepID=A0A5K1BG40_9MAGN
MRGKILQATVKEVTKYCDELKLSWKEIGHTMMANG